MSLGIDIGKYSIKIIELAQENQLNTIISHRSGDTEDTFISDLAASAQFFAV